MRPTLKTCYDNLFNKGLPETFLSDKGTVHSYIEQYESLLKDYREKPINLLEIGIYYGSCLEVWSRYFHKESKIYGLDCAKIQKFTQFGSIIYGDSSSIDDRNKLFSNITFDIIIEDGDHRIKTQIKTFENYFPLVKQGGLYIIEDIQNPKQDYQSFVSIGANPEIIDLRSVKGRHDDIMFIFKK